MYEGYKQGYYFRKVGFILQRFRQGQSRKAGSEILLYEVMLGRKHYIWGVFTVSYSYSMNKVFKYWKYFEFSNIRV